MTLGKFLLLGTSASNGVPVIGCSCSVCASSSSFNKRLRPSGLLQIGGKKLLIDVGPDFREQALKFKIDHLDGLILTHTHFDHIAGIDDLRVFCLRDKCPMPCLLSLESLADLKMRYTYLFNPANRSCCVQLDIQTLEKDMGPCNFLGVDLQYASYRQAGTKVNGFRVGDFAYLTDIREYDETIFSFLHGVKTLVLSAAREEPSIFHLSVDEALFFAKKAKIQQTWLTHLSHSLDYEAMNQKLPSSIQLGFDGQQIEFHI